MYITGMNNLVDNKPKTKILSNSTYNPLYATCMI